MNFDTKVYPVTEDSLKLAKEILLNDGVVAFPTETVYGIGGIATSENAIKKIYDIKGRPADNPLIVHIHKNYNINKLVYDEMDYVRKLREKFLPGALTLVYKNKNYVNRLVSSIDTLAIRVPSHRAAQRFLAYIDEPIAAPSANISKHVSPVTSSHVFNDLNGKIPLILEGGKSTAGIESTVLDVTSTTPVILRSGIITYDMIKDVVGRCEIYIKGDSILSARSPGVKYRHYSPKCETLYFKRGELDLLRQTYNSLTKQKKSVYILCDSEIARHFGDLNVLDLGSSAQDITANLYLLLREGEDKADYILGVELESRHGDYEGVSNRMLKAFGED